MARQNYLGLVVSQGKMTKTVKVRVVRKAMDKVVNKEVLKRKDFLVHDEGEIAREGDLVRIEQCRRISKRKAFAIAEIRKNQGQQFATYDSVTKAQVISEENAKTREFLERRKQTTEDIKNNTSLISDLTLIEKSTRANLSEEEQNKVSSLKTKYGIKDWPLQKDAIKLQIQGLRDELDELSKSVSEKEEFNKRLIALCENKEESDRILKELKPDVKVWKRHTRKNVLRKYLKELEKAGVSEPVSSTELDQDLTAKVEDLKI